LMTREGMSLLVPLRRRDSRLEKLSDFRSHEMFVMNEDQISYPTTAGRRLVWLLMLNQGVVGFLL
jgi:hypothetical protein